MANGNSARLGTWMSAKTLASAAVNGHRLDIGPLSGDPTISGYLVGMDDYYLKIVPIPVAGSGMACTHLVHKSAGLIRISAIATLDAENEITRDEVTRIGRAFWDYCSRKFFSNGSKESQ